MKSIQFTIVILVTVVTGSILFKSNLNIKLASGTQIYWQASLERIPAVADVIQTRITMPSGSTVGSAF